MIVFPPANQLAFMQAGYTHAGPGPFDLAKLHLFKGFVLNPPLVPTDLVEADFAGYTTPTTLWVPRILTDLSFGFSFSHLFAATDAVTPNTIAGWYVADSTSAFLLAWELFPTGYPMVSADSVMNLTVNIVLPDGTNFGNSVIG